MTKLDNLINIEQRRGLVMFVFYLLLLAIVALSSVVAWLYIDNSKQRERMEGRERECREEINKLHQEYGRQLVGFFERQREIQEQIQAMPAKSKRKK